MPERDATPEAVHVDRRGLIKASAAGSMIGGAAIGGASMAPRPAEAFFGWGSGDAKQVAAAGDPTADLYPVARNARYTLDRPLTDEVQATTYNNFYEFGSHKQISRAAQRMPVRPWTVRIDGMVEEPRTVDVDTLIRAMPLEERVYRMRCVEAWAMAVPWAGFQMSHLVAYAKPLSGAKYVVLTTFGANEISTGIATGLRQSWYPWPYVDGCTIAEANNELAFIATGLYGKPIPQQNGAPLRLVLPWKYGFKGVKSIVRVTFTDKRPASFWEVVQGQEYGFWANVNPAVPHPRWSQANERMLGSGESRPTQIYNGYGEFVADLYKGLENEKLFM
jgi:methionine sulfoxide reductase catalytic subunit